MRIAALNFKILATCALASTVLSTGPAQTFTNFDNKNVKEGYWGTWGSWVNTPYNGQYFCGLSVKAQPYNKALKDNTGINGITARVCDSAFSINFSPTDAEIATAWSTG